MTQPAAIPSVVPAPRRWPRRCLSILLVGAVLFVLVSWFSAYNLTRPRNHSVTEPPIDFPYHVETITFETGDGLTLRGWLFPDDDDDNDKAIILLHGYTGHRGTMLPRAKFFREQGYTVFAYDARACGESGGDCITFGYREADDLVATVDLLRKRGWERIACLGVSQGGATILLGAEKLDGVRCVICESVYDELEHAVDRRFRRYFGIPGWPACCLLVPFAEWRTGIAINDVKPVANIGKLPCPVLLISGDKDNRVYEEDTQALFTAAKEPKELWMIPGAGHEDLFRQNGYEQRVLEFVAKHMK